VTGSQFAAEASFEEAAYASGLLGLGMKGSSMARNFPEAESRSP
jgi:hypothetical protein